MNLPQISVILCTYNGAAFLKEQLQSVIDQIYPSIEIIISDDASDDGTKDILKTFEHYPFIKIFFQKENLGYIKNFEFGIRHASSELIALCDQDDVWLPHKLKTLVEDIDDAMLVYSDSLLINSKGTYINKKISDIRNMYSGNDARGFAFFNPVWGHSILFKKELLQYVLPIPAAVPHDIWLAFNAANIDKIKFCNQVLTFYRQHAATLSTTLPQVKQTPSRSMSARFFVYKKQLHWIKLLMENARKDIKPFFVELYKLMRKSENASYNFRLFFFLLRNQKTIYSFSKKSFFSRIADIRKIARGERA